MLTVWAIGKPRGVVFTGDLTGWGTAPTELVTFRHYFEAGNSADSIGFPAYLGLGNHDIDSADRPEDLASQYRGLEWGYLDSRHQGPNAPVPVTNYHAASHGYSFDLGRVHLARRYRQVRADRAVPERPGRSRRGAMNRARRSRPCSMNARSGGAPRIE